METPTWQLMAGGIGRPKPTRFIYSPDRRPFEEVPNRKLTIPSKKPALSIVPLAPASPRNINALALCEQVMAAIGSNKLDGAQRPVLLVLERPIAAGK